MRGLLLIAATLLSTLFATSSTARELWERDWIEVRTEHFTVASSVGEKQTRLLAAELEGFRATVRQLLGIRVDERVPTRVFIVPRNTQALNLTGEVLGWFSPGMRENLAVVSASRGSFSHSRVLFHEYTHFLVHNHSGSSYPIWFDEGFSELLMSLKVEPGRAVVGTLLPGRREWLEHGRWMNFSRLIRVRDLSKLDDEDMGLFYAQSWALVHYVMLGPDKAEFEPRMRRYRGAVESGEPEDSAFEQAFGDDPRRLKRRMQRYLSRESKVWGIALKEESVTAAPTVRAIPKDEIAARLGWVSVGIRDAEAAQKAFDAALSENPDNARALVGTADLHKFAGRFDQAEPLYRRAIELEPDDALNRLDYAEYFLDRAREARERDPEQSATWGREARRQFARSYALDDGIPETLAMNGASYLGEADGAKRAVEFLTAANDMLPAHPQIMLLLAQAYARDDRRQDALSVVRTLVAWSHSGQSQEANALLRELDRDAADETDADARETEAPGRAGAP